MNDDLIPIKTVLISVTDKTALIPFVDGLKKINPSIKMIASGGTFAALQEAGLSPQELSEYTGFPECFNGRVKTLHPKIAGGILFRRGVDDQEAKTLEIDPIDMVVCNLYDFSGAAKNADLEIEKLIEKLDIGGSTLIRSSCKNHVSVAVVVEPQEYSKILEEMQEHQGALSLATRKKLAAKALQKSAEYETTIAKELSRKLIGDEIHYLFLSDGKQLRYGENPDQKAWAYAFKDQKGIVQAEILAGKEVSYNNFEDATVAYNASGNFFEVAAQPNVVIVKHGSFCGAAIAPTLEKAFELAWEGDSKSAFGSVIALHGKVTQDLIPYLTKRFIEVLIAEDFSDEIIAWSQKNKPNLRLLKVPSGQKPDLLYKSVSGGMLVQTPKPSLLPDNWDQLLQTIQTDQGKPIGLVTKQSLGNINKNLFAFAVAAVHYAKSNTVAIVREKEPGEFQILALGVGQPNRVDTLQRLAIPKAIEMLQNENAADPLYNYQKDLEKCVLASDGFFFEDTIRYGAEHGIKYYIQPGGSVKDPEVIKAADSLGVCMIFMGHRYFYH